MTLLALMAAVCGTATTGHAAVVAHVQKTRAVAFDPLYYTDRQGAILARIRPYALLDQTNVAISHGALDLVLTLELLNLTAHPLTISLTSFALWGASGTLHRPAAPGGAPGDTVACARHNETAPLAVPQGGIALAMPMVMVRDDPTLRSGVRPDLTDAPLAPFTRHVGRIRFHLARREPLAGIVFTPDPDRLFVIADFSREATAIID